MVWIKQILIALVIIVLFFLLAVAVTSRSRSTSISFLDVGQGDSIFIETKTGIQVLIDAGRGRAVLRELGELMPFYDRSIDLVIATHPDQDHIGGFPEVLKRFRIATILDNGIPHTTETYALYQQAKEAEDATYLQAVVGMKLWIGAETYLIVLHPDRTYENSNDTSIVIALIEGDHQVLLTGDISATIEARLVARYGTTLQSDILKVAHHGSGSSSSMQFLETVRPTYSILSYGCTNRYGHPKEAVVERLLQIATNIIRTCTDGTSTFRIFERELARVW